MRCIKRGLLFPNQHYLTRFSGYDLSLKVSGTPKGCTKVVLFFTLTVPLVKLSLNSCCLKHFGLHQS